MNGFLSTERSWMVVTSTYIFGFMFLFNTILVKTYHKTTDKPSIKVGISLFKHMWLATLLLLTALTADRHHDPVLIWFVFLLIFRYYKTIVNGYFWFTYKPAVAPENFALSSRDVTVLVPTVGPKGNDAFAEMVAGILYNRPERLIFSTVNEEAKNDIKEIMPIIEESLENGSSGYQRERGLSSFKSTTEVKYFSANVASKREQTCAPLHMVKTPLLASADDTAIWPETFLAATIPAFTDDKVALVGTRKWVKRLPGPAPDSKLPWWRNAWNSYEFGFWNLMGGLYLVRHNFEARATDSADGAVFCVSGRTFMVLSKVMKDPAFQEKFLNEYITWNFFGKKIASWGPVVADDDLFLMRWVIQNGWKIKFQSTKEATITTVLGNKGREKFWGQCLRWSRTTMRQNPQILLLDRTVWWKHPWTTWTTFIPWLINAALVWDSLLLATLIHSEFYKTSDHQFALVAGIIGLIWVTKGIKTADWYWEYPGDFFRYFFPLPVFAVFTYAHSILKLYTMVTFFDLQWSGRKLPSEKERKD